MDTSKAANNIDEYIKTFSENIQKILQSIREVVKAESPEAVEAISYGMPTFKLNGKNLIHFAAFKDHISLFPTASKIENHLPEVAKYRTGKGTLQFLLGEPISMDLIRKIVQVRVKELS